MYLQPTIRTYSNAKYIADLVNMHASIIKLIA